MDTSNALYTTINALFFSFSQHPKSWMFFLILG